MPIRYLLALALLSLLIAACAAPQMPSSGELFAVERDTRTGELRLPDLALAPGQRAHFVIEPEEWPVASERRPPLAFGELIGGEDASRFLLLSGVQADYANTRARVVTALPEDWSHKGLRAIHAREGDMVHLPLAGVVGVEPGDWYFVLNRSPQGDGGLSTRIGALIQVEATTDQRAEARILHEMREVQAGDLALFAQVGVLHDRPAARIGLGDSIPDGTGSTLDALRDVLITLAEEVGADDVEIRTWPHPLDPSDEVGATDVLREHEPDLPHLVLGMLDELDGGLLYAHTSLGSTPRAAQLVGVLPGGMPLDQGVDETSTLRGLAVALLSTALAARGETARSLYLSLVESEASHLPAHLRYHLREHVVLALEQLGARQEAYAVISHDLEEAEAAGDVYTILNSLSIRSHVLERQGRGADWLTDARRFRELAVEHLPAASALLFHLPLARALRANGEIEEAEAVIRELESALGADISVDEQFSIALHRALVRVRDEDAAGALLALELPSETMEALDSDQRALLHALAAEFYALSGQRMQRAYSEHVARALDAAQSSENPGTRAFTYRRIADVFLLMDRPQESIGALEAALEAMLAYGDFEEAAGLQARLGFLQLESAQQMPPQRVAPMLIDSLRNLQRSGELALRLGASVDAAQVLLLAALLDQRFGNSEAAEEGMLLSYRLATAAAQGELALQAATQLRDLYRELGDFDNFQRFDEIAELWSRHLGVSLEEAVEERGPGL